MGGGLEKHSDPQLQGEDHGFKEVRMSREPDQSRCLVAFRFGRSVWCSCTTDVAAVTKWRCWEAPCLH